MAQAALSGPAWDARLRRGAGAKASHAALHLAARLVLARWPRHAGDPPAPRAALTGLQEDVALHLLGELVPVISEALDTHRRVVGAAVELMAARGRTCPPSRLSEPIMVRVGRHVAARSGPLDELAVARDVAEREATRLEPLDAEEFFDRHHTAYQRLWNRDGLAALRRYPPSRIGLGHDERPPMLGVPGERSWRLGTDRAVFDRYRLHFSDAALLRTRRPARRRASAVDADELAGREVWRACQGYGLAESVHRVVLDSLASASLDESVPLGSARRVWQQWCAHSRPITDGDPGSIDAGLVGAVGAKVRLWSADEIGWSLRNTYGDLSCLADLIVRAIVLKVWMGLLAVEREELGVVDSGLLNGWVSTALDRAVPDLVRERSTPSDVAPSGRRVHRTCELLAQHPDVARQLVAAGSDDFARHLACAAYESAAGRRWGAHWREHALTGTEAAAFVSSLATVEAVG